MWETDIYNSPVHRLPKGNESELIYIPCPMCYLCSVIPNKKNSLVFKNLNGTLFCFCLYIICRLCLIGGRWAETTKCDQNKEGWDVHVCVERPVEVTEEVTYDG